MIRSNFCTNVYWTDDDINDNFVDLKQLCNDNCLILRSTNFIQRTICSGRKLKIRGEETIFHN